MVRFAIVLGALLMAGGASSMLAVHASSEPEVLLWSGSGSAPSEWAQGYFLVNASVQIKAVGLDVVACYEEVDHGDFYLQEFSVGSVGDQTLTSYAVRYADVSRQGLYVSTNATGPIVDHAAEDESQLKGCQADRRSFVFSAASSVDYLAYRLAFKGATSWEASFWVLEAGDGDIPIREEHHQTAEGTFLVSDRTLYGSNEVLGPGAGVRAGGSQTLTFQVARQGYLFYSHDVVERFVIDLPDGRRCSWNTSPAGVVLTGGLPCRIFEEGGDPGTYHFRLEASARAGERYGFLWAAFDAPFLPHQQPV